MVQRMRPKTDKISTRPEEHEVKNKKQEWM